MTKTAGWVYLARHENGLYYIGHVSASVADGLDTPEKEIAAFNSQWRMNLDLIHKIPAKNHWIRWAELMKQFYTDRLLKNELFMTLVELTDDDVSEIKGMRS